MVAEKLCQFAESKGISITEFEKNTGLSQGLLLKARKVGSSIGSEKLERILSVYPELNLNWLFGKEDIPTNHHNINIGNSSNVGNINNDVESRMMCPLGRQIYSDINEHNIPLLPTRIARQPDMDVMQYLSQNADCVSTVRAVPEFPKTDLWAQVFTDRMEPSLMIGDLVGLQLQNHKAPLSGGCMYAVDSFLCGLHLGFLYDRNDHYEMTFKNPHYDKMIFQKDDVLNVFQYTGLIRKSQELSYGLN